MKKYYLRLLPECTDAYIWDIVKDCAEQASCDAYKAIVAEPHVYFTIADERIKELEITPTVLEGGFFNKACDSNPGCKEGVYVYLAERSNSVMFAEDIGAMSKAGIATVYPRDFDAQDDPARVFLQLTAGPYPRNIFDIPNDIRCLGWFLGVLCRCDSWPDSKEIVRCTYADVLARKPAFEGMVILSFDAEGYIFLMKKTCFDELYAGREYFGHGLEWRTRDLLPE